MYAILEKLENIEHALANPLYRATNGNRKSRSNNIKIVLVSHDNNLDWLIANKAQRDAISSFETSRVQPSRVEARDSLIERKPSVSEYRIKYYTFYELIYGHKMWRFMESDLSKKESKNMKREFMDVFIEVDDDVQINENNINKLSLKCDHTVDPRGPDLIFELNGRVIARRGAPKVSSYDEVMKGNVGGM